MEEIKVGEYVRTRGGIIGKVYKIEISGQGTRYCGERLEDTVIGIIIITVGPILYYLTNLTVLGLSLFVSGLLIYIFIAVDLFF